MRIAIQNRITFSELLNEFVNKKSLISNLWLWQLDLNIYKNKTFDYNKLQILLKKDLNQLVVGGTFSIIGMKFLDTNDMTLSNFLNGLIENKDRKYCPMCLKNKISYKLIWQVKEIKVCDTHMITLLNVCSSCLRKLTYAHETLGEGKCPYCKKTLFDLCSGTEIINYDQEDQLNRYKVWRDLLNTQYNREQFFPRGKELAMLLILFALGQKSIFERDKLGHLYSSDFVCRILKYIKDIDDSKNYRVTLPQISRVLYAQNISLEKFVNTDLPNEFVHSIFKELEIGDCLAPWCNSYGTRNNLKEVVRNAVIYNHRKYRKVNLCLDCGLLFGFDSNQIWCEIGDSIALAFNKIRPKVNAGVLQAHIQREYNLTLYQYHRIFAFLLRHKLLIINSIDTYYHQFQEQDYLTKFRKLLCTSGLKSQKANLLFGWSRMEYYYYYFDPNIQKCIYLDEIGRQDSYETQSVIRKRAVYKPRILSDDEMLILWVKAKQYVKTCASTLVELTNQSFCEILGRGSRWLSSTVPEIVRWFEDQKPIVKEQIFTNTLLERQDQMIRVLIDEYKIGSRISVRALAKKTKINEKYLREHGISLSIDLIINTLDNGIRTVEWLEKAVKNVGTGNRLLRLIKEK